MASFQQVLDRPSNSFTEDDVVKALNACKAGLLFLDGGRTICAFNDFFEKMITPPEGPTILEVGIDCEELIWRVVQYGLVPSALPNPSGWLEKNLPRMLSDEDEYDLILNNHRILTLRVIRISDDRQIMTAVDKTDMMELEKRSGEIWGNLEAALDGMSEGFCVLDKEMKVALWNDKFYSFLELPDHLHGPGVLFDDILVEIAKYKELSGEKAGAAGIDEVRTRGTCEAGTLYVETSSGRKVEIRFGESPRGGLIVLALDITRQKRIEKALAYSYRSLLSVVDAVPAIIDSKDAEGRYLFVNDGFVRHSGIAREEVVGKTSEELFGGVGGRWMDLLDSHLIQSHADSYTVEETFGFPNSSVKNWLTKKAVTTGGEGMPPSVLTVRFDVSDKIDAELQLDRAIHNDSLTGLPNRDSLSEHLQETLDQYEGSEHRFGLIFIHISGFSRVNVALGHHYGDRLLKILSERLVNIIRKDDFLARSGGNEFAILSYQINGRESLCQFSQRIRSVIEAPIELDGQIVHVTGRIGISIYPQNGTEKNQLLRAADLALQSAVGSPEQCSCFYLQDAYSDIKHLLKLENALRTADYDQEFQVHYQPQFSLVTGKLVGCEALLRWRQPVLGWVSPTEFIPVAEECGAIFDLGRWVLETVCRDMQSWHDKGGEGCRVAVNYSGVQFFGGHLVEDLEGILGGYNINPGLLQVEVTENVAMQDMDAASETLKKIKELGVRLSIDDFGTGYSSLSYLKSLPFDELKVDKSFVDDLPEDNSCVSVVRSIIALGHNLGMSVLAEGVEDKAQRSCLREAGCDDAQGYFFARPLPKTEFEKMLSDAG
ncbi:EAL domain-containing protein [Aestuariispira insulae]|uniref:Diguanylate cyclase (GGDEF)-like protein n=1 Tax=Aestuariispira insulae TaxID=1461337 RepID=A0A3D9HKG3_9PROT|nr:EAL domain-containing protein [Aestuariispira insulae]RED49964.1 diguanylate cyclase (GGDEF)-like protein [Aestuariispira insulae]